MARTYHKSRMESISLFSTSTALEGLELFNPLPDPLDGESDFLHEYNDDVYSCIEERKAPLSNLLAEDLLQELNFEGLYYYFLVLRQCIFNRGVLILRSQLLSRVIFLRFARNVNDCEKFSFRRQCDSLYFSITARNISVVQRKQCSKVPNFIFHCLSLNRMHRISSVVMATRSRDVFVKRIVENSRHYISFYRILHHLVASVGLFKSHQLSLPKFF